jgi:glycosyltransferase involved in cell wall biosynthesis
MIEGKRVAVVVPAFNEARLVGRVIETMPDFVDEIVVVDDGSDDGTADEVRRAGARRLGQVALVRHARNRGVGAAIRTGYRFSLARGADVVAVMAGDGQMDPLDLGRVVGPVVRDEADYAKGDRLGARSRPEKMPIVRYLGIEALTVLTRIAAGYGSLRDSQSGYTAISAASLRALPLSRLHPGYGYPNHLLILLGAARRRVVDVPVRPVYGEGEVSRLRPRQVAPRLAMLLCAGYLWRLQQTGATVLAAPREGVSGRTDLALDPARGRTDQASVRVVT